MQVRRTASANDSTTVAGKNVIEQVNQDDGENLNELGKLPAKKAVSLLVQHLRKSGVLQLKKTNEPAEEMCDRSVSQNAVILKIVFQTNSTI